MAKEERIELERKERNTKEDDRKQRKNKHKGNFTSERPRKPTGKQRKAKEKQQWQW